MHRGIGELDGRPPCMAEIDGLALPMGKLDGRAQPMGKLDGLASKKPIGGVSGRAWRPAGGSGGRKPPAFF